MKFKGFLTQNYQLGDFIIMTIHLIICIGLSNWLCVQLFKSGMSDFMLIFNIVILLFIELLTRNQIITKRNEDNDKKSS